MTKRLAKKVIGDRRYSVGSRMAALRRLTRYWQRGGRMTWTWRVTCEARES